MYQNFVKELRQHFGILKIFYIFKSYTEDAALVPGFSTTNVFDVDEMKGSSGKSLEEGKNAISLFLVFQFSSVFSSVFCTVI